MTEPTDGHTDDVKALLGSALADEPPLALDRDEVFREGRRRVRRRRLFATGGAIAGVVAVVVGAVMVTGLLADESRQENVPPAASRTESPAPSSTSTHPNQEHANALLHDFLMNNDALPGIAQMYRADGRSPAFTMTGDTYDLLLDVRLPPAEGRLSVSVGAADPARVARCADVPDANKGCAVRVERGIPVAVGTWKDYGTGEKRYIAFTVRPDGTRVTAIASNLSDTRRNKGAHPTGVAPVLDQDVLARLVTMPALRYPG